MRKLIAVILAVLTVIVSAPTYGAETMTFFEGKDQCLTALAAGAYTTYAVHGKWQGAVPKGTVAPLEASACLEGEVVGGRKWVVVPTGFKLRWNNNKPVAMEDCGGNPVYAIAYLAPTTNQEVIPAVLKGLPSERTVVVNSFNTVMSSPLPSEEKTKTRSTISTGGWIAIVGGILLIAGGIALASGGGSHNSGPQVRTGVPTGSANQ